MENKLSEEQIIKTACASVRLEGLPLPDDFEQRLADFNKKLISEEELLKEK